MFPYILPNLIGVDTERQLSGLIANRYRTCNMPRFHHHLVLNLTRWENPIIQSFIAHPNFPSTSLPLHLTVAEPQDSSIWHLYPKVMHSTHFAVRPAPSQTSPGETDTMDYSSLKARHPLEVQPLNIPHGITDYQTSPPSQTLRIDAEMEVVSGGPTSAASSGFGGSNGLTDNSGMDPSPSSNASSLIDYKYASGHQQGAVSGADGTYPPDVLATSGCYVSPGSSGVIRRHFFPSDSVSYQAERHQSLPTESTTVPHNVCTGPRRQSSPGCQRRSEVGSYITSRDPCVFALPVNRLNLRARYRSSIATNESNSPSATNHNVNSTSGGYQLLESIPQGQELSVGVAAPICQLPMSPNVIQVNATAQLLSMQRRLGVVENSDYTSRAGIGGVSGTTVTSLTATTNLTASNERVALMPCCACPVVGSVVTQNEHYSSQEKQPKKSLIHEPIPSQLREKSDLADGNLSSATNRRRHTTYSQGDDIDPDTESMLELDPLGKSDPRSGGTRWARDFLGRLRGSPNHTTLMDTNPAPGDHNSHARGNHSWRRHTSPNRSLHDDHQHGNSQSTTAPELIDPRRLPKTHGPASVCLQFSKKPLQPFSSSTTNAFGSFGGGGGGGGGARVTSASPTSVIPNGVLAALQHHHQQQQQQNRGSTGGQPATWSALRSASLKPRKQSAARVRWFSQSISEETNSIPSDSFMGGSGPHARLSCSAVEEIQGAVDILAGRFQPFAPSGTPARTGVRVKRASESERIVVISKSLSESRDEESVPCSFGQFDESHIYSTLFRHCTCYDVLPDSGKLIMLDSRLGVVRAINALLENGAPAAPVWHLATQRVIGLFSQEFALHLLASLHETIAGATTNGGGPNGGPGCFASRGLLLPLRCEQPAGHAAPVSAGETNPMGDTQPTSIGDGLRLWGSRHLADVFRFINSDSDRDKPCLIDQVSLVSPQTRLRKALCRLLHPFHRTPPESPEASIHCHSRRPSNRPTSEDTSHSNRHHHHSDEPQLWDSDVEQFMDTSGDDCCFPMDNNTDGVGMGYETAVGPSGGGSATRCSSSSSTNTTTRLPLTATHLVVMDPVGGNVLGVLGADRLLAYLRLRLDELPQSPRIAAPIDSIPGLRWSERRMALTRDTPHSSTTSWPNPILSAQMPCHEALHTMALWLPQLPALPVLNGPIPSSASNTAGSQSPSTLLGFLHPGDLLHCRFHQDCVCHTREPIVDVLDRMFRLKAPCLVLYDAVDPSKHAGPMAYTGPPVGLVTARDLLRAIVEQHHHHHHRPRQNSSSSHTGWTAPLDSTVMTVNDEHQRRSSDSFSLLDTSSSSSSSSSSSESTDSSSGSTFSAHSDAEATVDEGEQEHAVHPQTSNEGATSHQMEADTCLCTCHRQEYCRLAETTNGKQRDRPSSGAAVVVGSAPVWESGTIGARTTNAQAPLPPKTTVTAVHRAKKPEALNGKPNGNPRQGRKPNEPPPRHIRRGDEEDATMFPMD